MEYIKRGEVPSELKNLNTNGQQVEVKNLNSKWKGASCENVLGTSWGSSWWRI